MADRTSIEELRRRVELNPASIAFAALAEAYRRAGLIDQAIDTCVAGLRRHPSYTSARVTLGRALLQAGRTDDARVELETALRLAPDNLAAIRALAEIHERETSAAAIEQAPAPQTPDTSSPIEASAPVPLARTATRVEPPRPEERQIEALRTFLAAIEQLRHGGRRPRHA